MYTQCPECKSVFEITATDLAVAGGFVRCGQCAASFDALNSLRDSKESADDGTDLPDDLAADFAADADRVAPAATEDAAKPDQRTAAVKESIDDPADARSQTGADAAEEVDIAGTGSAGSGTAETGADDEADIDDDDDEILLDDAYEPPLSDEDFFDDEDAVDAGADSDDRAASKTARTEHAAGVELENQTTRAFDNTGHGIDPDEPQQGQDGVDHSALLPLPLPALTALEHAEHGVLPEKLEGGEAAYDPSAQAQTRHAPATTPVAATTPATPAAWPWLRTNDAYDARDAHDLKEYLSDPVNRRARAAWLAGSLLMAFVLIGQVVHRYRGDLVIHPRFGPVVHSLYQAVGVDLRPNWRVNAYKVVGQARLFLMPLDNNERGDGNENAEFPAPDEAEDSTAIRFVAIIMNDARLPQPAPIVRLTLRDRWGDATGARNFTPTEYLAEDTMTGELLEPGQRLRVVLNLFDFGSDAVGFDFDMCLPDDSGTLRCASEA